MTSHLNDSETDCTYIPRAAKVASCRRALVVMLKHHGNLPPEPGAAPLATRIRKEIVGYAEAAAAALEQQRHRADLAMRRERAARRRALQRVDDVGQMSIADILAAVAACHGASIDDVLRRHTFADWNTPHALALAETADRARQAGYSLSAIGEALGGRDHTTIHYQAQKHRKAQGEGML